MQIERSLPNILDFYGYKTTSFIFIIVENVVFLF